MREVDVDNTVAGRHTLHWPTAMVLFQENPVFGIGTGLFYYSVLFSQKDVLCSTSEKLCPDNIQPTDISSTAHNIYLQVLAENGIIGFALFLLLFATIIVFGYKKVQQECMKKDFCSLFIFAALLAFLLQGFFFSYFEYREMSYLFWLFVGLLMKKQ